MMKIQIHLLLSHMLCFIKIIDVLLSYGYKCRVCANREDTWEFPSLNTIILVWFQLRKLNVTRMQVKDDIFI